MNTSTTLNLKINCRFSNL